MGDVSLKNKMFCLKNIYISVFLSRKLTLYTEILLFQIS